MYLSCCKREKPSIKLPPNTEHIPLNCRNGKRQLKAAIEGLPDLFEHKERELKQVEKEHQQEIDRLYKKIGDLTIQVDRLKKIYRNQLQTANERN